MTTCSTCKLWLLKKENHYESSEVIITWEGNDGKGKCQHLDVLTPPEFGCIAYSEGGPLIKTRYKMGESWHHKHYGPCPNCKPSYCGYPDCKSIHCPGMDNCKGIPARAGGGYDDRCAGTGLVYYYDDGYIGENRTKLHPKEKELGKRPDGPYKAPICQKCSMEIDEKWNLCPNCGFKLREGEPTIIIDDRVSILGFNNE